MEIFVIFTTDCLAFRGALLWLCRVTFGYFVALFLVYSYFLASLRFIQTEM